MIAKITETAKEKIQRVIGGGVVPEGELHIDSDTRYVDDRKEIDVYNEETGTCYAKVILDGRPE